jgi:hypothetical protein
MNNRPFEGLAATLADRATRGNRTTVRTTVKLHPETVARAEEVAKMVKPKRTVTRRVKAVTVVSIKVDPRVMEAALEIAGGDHSRLTIERDGSVVVWNHPRTTKPQDNR